MNEQYLDRATISPIPSCITRPLWSVMIPTYNCANYLRQTLASVLAQDPGSEIMQIEVIDDHSTQDDPAAVVEELGRGRVTFHQHPENVGHTKNFETCLQRSRGHLIHLLHGDDCVRDGFYHKLQRGFEESPEIGAAFCRHVHMDEQGHWTCVSYLEQAQSGILSNWLDRIAVQQRIQTPSIVVRRSVYEALGGFDRRMSWSEDWEMWVRIAAQYPVWYEVEPLACYRRSSGSITGRCVKSGKNIQDMRKAINIVRQYLPNENAHQLTEKVLMNYALYALNSANEFVKLGDTSSAINQLREALICSSSLRIVRSSTKLSAKIIYQMLASKLR